jgi:hypothetical protein
MTSFVENVTGGGKKRRALKTASEAPEAPSPPKLHHNSYCCESRPEVDEKCHGPQTEAIHKMAQRREPKMADIGTGIERASYKN